MIEIVASRDRRFRRRGPAVDLNAIAGVRAQVAHDGLASAQLRYFLRVFILQEKWPSLYSRHPLRVTAPVEPACIEKLMLRPGRDRRQQQARAGGHARRS